MPALLQSSLPLPVRRGKVRDVYDLGDRLLIVASDRLSAFDVILPTGIPDKGTILTQLSNHWFGLLAAGQLSGLKIQSHLIQTDPQRFPSELHSHLDQLRGRSILVRKTNVIPIECVVRGYITGSGWKDYLSTGHICGIALPANLRQCDRLPTPLFTPTTKADQGHDEPISFDGAAAKVGHTLMSKVRDLSIQLYQAAAAAALAKGIIIADTKFEWGTLPGEPDPILIDEILTPDSSRFWPADDYEAGHDQPSFDKQYVRNYLETLTWNKQYPGPALPDDVVDKTRQKYVEAYERLTGAAFH